MNNDFIESYTGQNLRDSQKSLKGTCLESMYQKRLKLIFLADYYVTCHAKIMQNQTINLLP